jgi:hypothetical protein
MIYPRNTPVLKLPCDAMHAIFALSLRRKLRKLYSGNYFKFIHNNQEFEYPRDPLINGSKLSVVYDQKVKHGVEVMNAEQSDPEKQPTLYNSEDGPYAQFELGEYLDIEGIGSYMNEDFTITAIGSGDAPRPMIGIWGDENTISVEPAQTSRFRFNDNHGSISQSANDKINQYFSGLDESQNGNRVLVMKSDAGGSGQIVRGNIGSSFLYASIGRQGDRLFKGEFIEATLHNGELTKIGSQKLWEEAKSVY